MKFTIYAKSFGVLQDICHTDWTFLQEREEFWKKKKKKKNALVYYNI